MVPNGIRSFFLVAGVMILLLPSCKKDPISIADVQTISSGTTDRLNKILFVNDSVGFVVGGDRFNSCTILRTTDGGKNFTPFSLPESGKSNYGIEQKPDGTLVIIGFDGKYITSTDQGLHWQLTQLAHWRPLKDVCFFNNDEGLLIDGISFNSGVRYQINETGATRHLDSGAIEWNDVEKTNNQTALIAGTGAVMKSDDKGKTWQFLPPKNDNFSSLCHTDEHHIWVCGTEGTIYASSDGGITWEKQRNGNKLAQKKYHFHDILFVSNQEGYVVGEEGIMMQTTDGGSHWQAMEKFTSKHLRQIAVCPNGVLLVCGDGGALFRIVP